MPAFSTSTAQNIPCLQRGGVITLFNAEQPAAGATSASASIVVGLTHGPGEQANTPFSVDGVFSGAPQAFEVDVMVAEAITPFINFQTVAGGNITTVDATNNTFHLDVPNVTAKFMLAMIRTRTNAVNLTMTVNG